MLSERPRLAVGKAHLREGDLHLLIHGRWPRWAALNPAGYQVACLCDGTRTAAQIVSGIAARYGRGPVVVRDDVASCLARLQGAGLLAGDDELPACPRPTLAGLRLHLNLAGRCNLRCIHCGVEPVPASAELPTGAVLHLIDELAAGGGEGIAGRGAPGSSQGEAWLAVSGGEPLLHDGCLDVLRYAVERLPNGSASVVLATNGTLIDAPVAAELVRLGVIVQVSLDGATPEVHDRIRGAGAFERAWRGIERLQRAGIGEQLALSYTLMKPNLADVPRAVELAERRAIAGLRFFPVQRLGRAAAAWAELGPTPEEYGRVYTWLYRGRPRMDKGLTPSTGLRTSPSTGLRTSVRGGLTGFVLDVQDAEMGCRLGHTLAVDAAGEIYPCSLLIAPRFRLGNVREISLAEALASEQLRDLLALCAGRMEAIEACRACTWRAFCQAGCPASVWWQRGTFDATDGLCDLRRGLYREGVFERARRGLGEQS